MKSTCFTFDGTEPICMNCTHYHLHYTYIEDFRDYRPAYAGHCATPRIKDRKPCAEACHNFEMKKGR